MKIIFIEWNGYANKYILEAFSSLNIRVISVPFDKKSGHDDLTFEADLKSVIVKEHLDFVFSFNFFPSVSRVCMNSSVKYVSWVYDSPQILLYSYTLINSYNYVFLFDRTVYEEFQRAGVKTVYYLPLAVPDKIPALEHLSRERQQIYKSDISFVGSLYTEEKHRLYERFLPTLSEYAKGYIDGLMQAQMNVYGANFIRESLTPQIIQDLHSAYAIPPNADGVEDEQFIYADYVINRHITSLERQEILTLIASKHPVTLYTNDKSVSISGVENRGYVDYYDQMPCVFACSSINLNITLRSIKSGMSLRAFDILGAGGFLLTNYQSEFLDFFTPGEDFDFFESREDLLCKIDYYLSHPKERAEIAQNGQYNVLENHTYQKRLEYILSTIE